MCTVHQRQECACSVGAYHLPIVGMRRKCRPMSHADDARMAERGLACKGWIRAVPQCEHKYTHNHNQTRSQCTRHPRDTQTLIRQRNAHNYIPQTQAYIRTHARSTAVLIKSNRRLWVIELRTASSARDVFAWVVKLVLLSVFCVRIELYYHNHTVRAHSLPFPIQLRRRRWLFTQSHTYSCNMKHNDTMTNECTYICCLIQYNVKQFNDKQ